MKKRKNLRVKSAAGNINVSNKWTFLVTVLAFVLSVIFTIITDSAETLPNFVAITVLFVIVLLSILFDMLGMAVSTATEEPFHAMAAKKIPAAKTSIKIIRSSQQLSSLFNDVIGDIAGIISGAMTAAIVAKIATSSFGINMIIELGMTGLVAAVMIGGKAAGKGIAMTNNNTIVFILGKVVYFFENLFTIKNRKKH